MPKPSPRLKPRQALERDPGPRLRAGSLPATLQRTASPLFEALLRARRERTPEAYERYQDLLRKVDRLKMPATPSEERLRLLAELEQDGWAAYSEWPRLKRTWKYAGAEWHVPITDDQLQQLRALDGKSSREAWAALVRSWLEFHPELGPRLLEDMEGFHFLIKWVACRLWAPDERDDGFARWLLEEIVDKVLGDVRLPALKDLRAPDGGLVRIPRLVKDDLRGEAFAHLLRVVRLAVPAVEGRLEAYWRTCAKNAIRRVLTKEGRFRRRFPLSLESPTHGNDDQSWTEMEDWDPADLEPAAQLEDRIEAAQRWRESEARLTRLTKRQRQIILLKATGEQGDELSNAEVAHRLGISLSTVEKDLAKSRRILAEDRPQPA